MAASSDEIWGHVVTCRDAEYFVLNILAVATDRVDAYRGVEIVQAAAQVRRGDFVHVWVRGREASGLLVGKVAIECGVDSDEFTAEDEAAFAELSGWRPDGDSDNEA